MLARVIESTDRLGPAERRLAEVIIRAPGEIAQLSLAALAARASVSEPTVIRFCRRLGCAGFPDFRLRLAQELASGTPYVHREVDFSDTLETVAEKIFGSSISNLQSVADGLNVQYLQRAIDLVTSAHRIQLFATGQTSVVAIDAQQKFMFVEIPAIYQQDTQLQLMSATTLRPTDVALCFSYTGQKMDIVRCAKAARAAGAAVVTVTRSGSALAAEATINIPIDVVENAYLYSPMATRLAQLVVVDVLATGVALRRGEAIVGRIRRMKETVQDRLLRVPEE